jgi:hypothetical protein
LRQKPSGGSISPLERHAEFLLGLIAERPGMTLDEIVAANKACLTRRDWCSLTRPAPTPRWYDCAAALYVASGSSTTRRTELGKQSPSWAPYDNAG